MRFGHVLKATPFAVVEMLWASQIVAGTNIDDGSRQNLLHIEHAWHPSPYSNGQQQHGASMFRPVNLDPQQTAISMYLPHQPPPSTAIQYTKRPSLSHHSAPFGSPPARIVSPQLAIASQHRASAFPSGTHQPEQISTGFVQLLHDMEHSPHHAICQTLPINTGSEHAVCHSGDNSALGIPGDHDSTQLLSGSEPIAYNTAELDTLLRTYGSPPTQRGGHMFQPSAMQGGSASSSHHDQYHKDAVWSRHSDFPQSNSYPLTQEDPQVSLASPAAYEELFEKTAAIHRHPSMVQKVLDGYIALLAASTSKREPRAVSTVGEEGVATPAGLNRPTGGAVNDKQVSSAGSAVARKGKYTLRLDEQNHLHPHLKLCRTDGRRQSGSKDLQYKRSEKWRLSNQALRHTRVERLRNSQERRKEKFFKENKAYFEGVIRDLARFHSGEDMDFRTRSSMTRIAMETDQKRRDQKIRKLVSRRTALDKRKRMGMKKSQSDEEIRLTDPSMQPNLSTGCI